MDTKVIERETKIDLQLVYMMADQLRSGLTEEEMRAKCATRFSKMVDDIAEITVASALAMAKRQPVVWTNSSSS